MKQCTGCGRYDNEPIGLNKNGEPYLACCPDNNYIELNQMKLYTEEQVIKAYKDGNLDGFSNVSALDMCIDSLTPIELPSDEEIEESETDSPYDRIDEYNYGFIDGANWVKQYILNQNK